MPVVSGIDGCPSGWVCLSKNLSSGVFRAQIISNIDELMRLDPRPDLALVDVPIGLTDAGPRECDLEARKRLRHPRSRSVFPAPVRSVLNAESYAQACRIGESKDGRKLSKQVWAILPKIREVDAFLRSDRSLQTWVREVHPELCFWAWNGEKAMSCSKKSRAGRFERENLVTAFYGEAYENAKASLPHGGFYRNDDLLDAFAALWSAEREVAGIGLLLPAIPTIDSFGLRMEMVV